MSDHSAITLKPRRSVKPLQYSSQGANAHFHVIFSLDRSPLRVKKKFALNKIYTSNIHIYWPRRSALNYPYVKILVSLGLIRSGWCAGRAGNRGEPRGTGSYFYRLTPDVLSAHRLAPLCAPQNLGPTPGVLFAHRLTHHPAHHLHTPPGLQKRKTS